MAENGQPSYQPHFTRIDATADTVVAAEIRRDFSAWLRRHFVVDSTKSSDVVLAVNEALANAAEFAYLRAEQPGPMHMQAEYDPTAAILAVTVTDEGAWQETDGQDRTRGRGIPLMRALADRVNIDPTSAGTRVRMEWDRIAVADAAQAHNWGNRTT